MLDDVLQLLKGHLAIRPLARRGIKESNNEASTFVTQGGLFDTLDVEDVSDGAGVVNVEETIPNKPTLDETQARYTPEIDPTSERRMKFFYLLEDAENLLSHTQPIFGDREDIVPPGDPVVTSIIAETAVVILRQREEAVLEVIHKDGDRYSPVLATGPQDRFRLPSLSLAHISECRMVLKDVYRLPLEPFRFRVPSTVTNATPGTKPLLDPATYAMFEELDSQIIRYLLDLNLECRVRRSLWEKNPIQVKNLKRPLLSTRLDEISRVLMPVNERFHLNASYKIVQTAFAADLLLLMGRDALNASMQHPALNGLMDLQREQLKKDKETGIRIDIGTSTQYEQWKTVHTWVGSCPFPAARQAAIDITASAPKPKQLLKGAIEPVSDVLFLRKMNPSLSSKLHLTLFPLQEEVGLSLLDSSPHAFAMCYLYTTLHIKGALSRDKFGLESSDQEKRDRSSEGAPSGSNIVMHDIEAICEQHGPELFGSLDFSDSTARVADVTKIRAGSPSQGWKIGTIEPVALLRDYIHGNISFWQMLGSPEQRSLLDTDVILFLTKLREYVEEAVEWMSFDYMTVHSACKTLFERMHLNMGDVTQGKTQQPSADDWKLHTKYALEITRAALGQLDRALAVEDTMRRGMVPGRIINTPWLDIALEETKHYCAAGGRGFVD